MAALMISSSSLEAQTVKVYPRYGTVVTKVYQPRVVVHSGVNFYYAEGVWYKPYGRRYVVCKAPLGIRLKYIPRGHRIVRVDGKKYYHYNGIWYTKKRGYYTVVRVS